MKCIQMKQEQKKIIGIYIHIGTMSILLKFIYGIIYTFMYGCMYNVHMKIYKASHGILNVNLLILPKLYSM